MALVGGAVMSIKQAVHSFSPNVVSIVMHILIETPAGLNFILRPSYTLSSPSQDAHPVIRQYGLLLIILNGLLGLLLMDFCYENSLVNGIGGISGTTSTSKQSHLDEQTLNRICGLLFLYHIGPFWRALSNACRPHSRSGGRIAYGGPLVIAAVHGGIGAGLLGAWLHGLN